MLVSIGGSESNHNFMLKKLLYWIYEGAQWVSGRVLDSRQRGRGFNPQRCHCIVVLEQDTFILG